MGKMIEYSAGDKRGSAYLALPGQGNGPGVLLLHAWWGLNDFFKELADRLAAEGFVVLAPDLYDGKIASTIEDAERLGSALDANAKEAIGSVTAAADYLLGHPGSRGSRIGAIGFSLGSAYAIWLSTLKPELAAVVLFYGVWPEESFARETGAAFLGHFAEHDPYESHENVRLFEAQLRSAGKQATFFDYPGTGHWFFEEDRPDAYDADAAAIAWQATLDFLHDKLK
jgi:carboxymethylenebutenolidase